MTRHFLADDDLSPAEQAEVLALAAAIKRRAVRPDRRWRGPRTVAMIFDKPTLRTQASFAAGIAELGGHPMLVDGQLAGIGVRESIADVARVLGRQAAMIVWRTYGQDRIDEMAAAAGVPVVNALTDDYHPCQLLADLLTVQEHRGTLAGQRVAFVGDGACNMGNSWLLAGATAGMHVVIGAPEGYTPDAADGRACCRHRRDDRRLGRPRDRPGRRRHRRRRRRDRHLGLDGQGGRVRRPAAGLRTLVGHDRAVRPGQARRALPALPARLPRQGGRRRGDRRSRAASVWDEAENRRHAQKAILTWLLERSDRDE